MSDKNMLEGEMLETLNDIKELLKPKPGGPIQIKADDQPGLNANIEKLARGEAVMIPAEVKQPTYGAGVKQISSTDQAAINRHIDQIASGKAVVV